MHLSSMQLPCFIDLLAVVDELSVHDVNVLLLCIPVAKCIAAFYCTYRSDAILLFIDGLHDKCMPRNSNFLFMLPCDDSICYKSLHNIYWRLRLICFALSLIEFRIWRECHFVLFLWVLLFNAVLNGLYDSLSLELICMFYFWSRCYYLGNDVHVEASDAVEYARTVFTIRWL